VEKKPDIREGLFEPSLQETCRGRTSKNVQGLRKPDNIVVIINKKTLSN